jgi:uncharacterized Ntn-hydrolase superfamily protein/outer membrane protein OmpA-like peptidoglycan-associated protein
VRDERRLARGPFLPTRLAALTLTLCAALAGCGGESDDEVEEPATATVEEARPAAPDPEPTAPDVPPVERLDAIPLMPGLTVVTAVTQSLGDFESVKQIASVDDEGYWIHYSADGVDRAGQSRTVRARRKVLWEDLRSAPSYRLPFGEEEPELVPGTTAISVSTAVFEGIRDDGTGTLQVIGNLTPEQAASALVAGDSEFTGTVSVVGEEPFPTIVNGVPSLLPAVRIRGRLTDDVALEPFEFEGVFLDDARHPLALRWRLAEQGIDVVRVDWTGEATFDLLEERLSLGQSVALHGIYFDFGSATLRPESEFVLDGLASILREHPDWRIRIEGHTDDIGDVSANLALSERRAGAVRQALIDRLEDGPERFEVIGLGEARPVATNETLEGRARNRRVELVRIEPDFNTFSIVAVDPETGETGVAVTTRNTCVGNGVPWVRAGVGAVATQAATRVEYGPELLDRLAEGAEPEQALRALLDDDARAPHRQIGVVAVDGQVAQHTGPETNPWAGHRSGDGYAVQGNLLVGREVIDAVAESFESTRASGRHLADRLVAALEAGQARGGDARKGRMQSAAVRVADPREGVALRPDGESVFIHVCEHPTPVAELRRIHDTSARVLGHRVLERASGSDVGQLLIMLHALGYYRAELDSLPRARGWDVYDADAVEAVDRFRADRGLSTPERGSPAGLVDGETVEHLWAALDSAGLTPEVRRRIRDLTRIRR